MTAYCYLLECNDGSFYCGWTNDLEKRLTAHQAGTGSRYTRAHLPVKLVYFEIFAERSQAMRRESEIKSLDHIEKKELVEHFEGQ